MNKPPKKLGDLLIEAKLITPAQLQEALQLQKQTRERLGQVLINLGYVTEQDIIHVLEKQFNVSYLPLHKLQIDPQVLQSVPEQLIKRHRVIPYKKEGNKLTLVVSDPLNLLAIDEIKVATGYDIKLAISTEREIEAVIRRHFTFSETIEKIAREADAYQGVVTYEPIDLDKLENDSDEAPVVKAVNTIIQQAVRDRASDIHIEPHETQLRVRYRVDGILRDIMNLPKQVQGNLISRIKILADMDIAEKRLPQDGRIQIKSGKRSIDLRVASIPTIFGEKIVIRILDKGRALLSIDQLGFQPVYKEKFLKMLNQAYGIILITGPTGSGKTTTLYTALNHLNSQEKNIITLEDPVEYLLPGINQVQVNPKAGLTFASGLRSILRLDPDIIMVGEIRDRETAEMAVRAATTGHLVLTTLHTNDAAGTLTRLIDMGIEPYLVASSVVGIVTQRLVRVICPNCKSPYGLPPDAPEAVFFSTGLDQVTLYKGTGCGLCGNTGYQGRIALHEVLFMNSRLRELTLAKVSSDTIRQAAIESGMITLQQDGLHKALAGLTSLSEVMRVTYSESM